MTWTTKDAIQYCISTLKWTAIYPWRVSSVTEIPEKTKTVIFRVATSNLEIGIPFERKNVVSCYVPNRNLVGVRFPYENPESIHAAIEGKLKYPRPDGKKISGRILDHAPSLHPSRNPFLLTIKNHDGLVALLKWYVSIVAEQNAPAMDRPQVAPADLEQAGRSVVDSISSGASALGSDRGLDDSFERDIARTEMDQSLVAQKLGETEINAWVKQRLGQGSFRARLLPLFGGKCPLSGVGITELLIASHVRPWSKSDHNQRRDPENGLLLSVNWDALFDKGLVTFSDDGDLLISDRLDTATISNLGIALASALPSHVMTAPRKSYMQYHREHRFEKWKK